MPPTAFDKMVDDVFGPPLEALGFERSRGRVWVRSRKRPLRELFQLQALKGATYSSRWGFDLDFVLLFRGNRFRSKRTIKGAGFDLIVDPIDPEGEVPDWCSFAHFPGFQEVTQAKMDQVAAASIRAAERDYVRIQTIQDFVSLFEERSKRHFPQFSLDNYIQTDLAWGLALHALGRAAEGNDHLDRFAQRLDAARDHPALARAIAKATSPVAGLEAPRTDGGR